MSHERQNIKAGLFVLLGALLALVVIVTLSDFRRWTDRRQTVVVSYRISDGLKGLKLGAQVTLGDEPLGEVVGIEDVTDPDSGRVTGKRVVFTIPQRYKLFRNAVIEAKAPAIGSGTRLNIRSVGDTGPYQPGDVIEGSVAGSDLTRSLVTDVGIGDEQRQQIRHIIANVESITATLREDLPPITASVKRILADAEPMIADARVAMADARVAVHDATEITDRTKRIVTRVEELLKDKDPTIRATLDHVHAITAHVKEKTMAQVDEALAKADAALANLKLATAAARDVLVGQRPVLERAVANAQLTTDQLKLAAIEIRRSPWRLLYKPGDEELETDNLYDAARSFAQAAGTLDAAAQSLRALVNEPATDADSVARMVEHLEKLFGKYQQAEAAFWKALEGRKP